MSRKLRLEILMAALYLALFLVQDKDDAIRLVARTIRWYGNRCRDAGNWCWTRAIQADNAYRELMTP